MRGRISTIYIALALLMVSCLPAMAQGSAGPTTRRPMASEPEWKPKPVTLDLKGVPLNEAIEQVIAATDLAVLRVGEIPAEPRVTMILVESNPTEVLRLLSEAGSLRYSESRRMASGPLLVLLAADKAVARAAERRRRSAAPATVSESAPAQRMPVEMHLVIDLNVEDAPFREAVAQITAQIPESKQVRIMVDDSVPDDIRVTARVHKMRLSWVLDNLVGQADLAYGLQEEVDPTVALMWQIWLNEGLTNYLSMREGLAGASRVKTVHIVPRPELQVSSGDKK